MRASNSLPTHAFFLLRLSPRARRIGKRVRVVLDAVGLAVRARLDGLRQLRQRVLYAVSGRCVCTFAREVRQRALYAVSGRCVCTCAREVLPVYNINYITPLTSDIMPGAVAVLTARLRVIARICDN